MLFVTALILALLFAFFLKNAIKKHSVIFYAAAAVVSVAGILVNVRNMPAIVQNIAGLFTRGVFATALWCIIMWIGALKNGSKLIKALMPIRGELSIIAAILTLGHNIGYGKTYFVRMFTAPLSMRPTHLAAGTLSLIMLVIMIPLTILSVPSVRKKMSAKRWKKIQRMAYLFYAFIYLHVMILFVPSARSGNLDSSINVIAYSIVFLGYAACRIKKAVIRKKPDMSKMVSRICGAAFVAGMVIVIILLIPFETEDEADIPDAGVDTSASVESETFADSETEVLDDISDDQSIYNDGKYTASAYGYDGDITVTITIENDKITAVEASSEEEDTWYFDQAKSDVIGAIIAFQSTEVDAVSGATYSSKGIMKAVEAALGQAKK